MKKLAAIVLVFFCVFLCFGADAEYYHGYQTVPTGTYDDFYSAVYGNWYDVDGGWGAQCWDGVSLLWNLVKGTYLRTGDEGIAKECWTYSRDFNAGNQFYLIDDVTKIQKGDVLVFGAGEFGHICYANEDYAPGMTDISVLGQNQSRTQDPRGGHAFDVSPYGLGSFLGAFRYIGWADRSAPTFPEGKIRVSNIRSRGFTISCKAADDRAIVAVSATAWPVEEPSRRTDFPAVYDPETGTVTAEIDIEQMGYLTDGYSFTLYARDKSGNVGGLTSMTGISQYAVDVTENGRYKATADTTVYIAPYESYSGISTASFVLAKNEQRNVVGSFVEDGVKWYRLEAYGGNQWVRAEDMTKTSFWDNLWNSIVDALTGSETNVYIVDENTWYAPEGDAVMIPGRYSYTLENYNMGDPTASDPDAVPIDETNFPDSAFRDFIYVNYDRDGDHILSPEELEAVSRIIITRTISVESLEGVEHFENLVTLECPNQSVKALDLSANTALERLDCTGNNGMTSLNLSGCTKLKNLACDSVGLPLLDLTNCTELEAVNCSKNGAARILLGSHPSLAVLYCDGNGLTDLDLSGCPTLEMLDCSGNNLTTLDISQCTGLKVLYCGKNAFTSLAPVNASLVYMDCMNCPQLASLNVNGCPQLEQLWCRNCVLTELHTEDCAQLNELWCNENRLTALDISRNANLGRLYCVSNRLETLDVTHNPALWGLSCGGNLLTGLDVSHNPLLRDLSCYGNRITELDLDQNPLLEGLRTSENRLVCLNLWANNWLGYVWADGNTREVASTVNLDTLPGFDPGQVSNVTGALLAGRRLVLTEETAQYDYRCNSRYTVRFTVTGEPEGILDSGDCGSGITWVLYESGVLAIYGEGRMDDFMLHTMNPEEAAPWYKYQDKINTVYIENGITNIGRNAFWGCTVLEDAVLPVSLTEIGSRAFAGCGALKRIDIPPRVQSIGEYAFISCTSLPAVKLPDSVTFLGKGVFMASGVKSVGLDIPITEIPEDLFSGCTNLELVAIPSGVTAIGANAFNLCGSLNRIGIPDGVTTIGRGAFTACTGLNEINIPESVTDLGESAFSGCTGLTEVTVPSGITVLQNNVFGFCEGLASVNLPEGMTRIGNRAFQGCTALTAIDLPVSLVSIGEDAFYRSGLTSVFIPVNVAEIGNAAFSTDPLAEYRVDPDNAYFCDEGKALYNKDRTKLVAIPREWTRFVIPEGVTEIGPWACYGCKLEHVKMPDSLTTIGAYAFNACWRVDHYVIPGNVTTIGTAAFWWCEMSAVTIPKSVEVIKSGAFDDCTSLKDVYYTGSEAEWASVEIGPSNDPLLSATIHFNSLPVPADLVLPSSLKAIEAGAFTGIPEGTVIYVPDTVESIADTAFDPGTVLISPSGSFAADWAERKGFEHYEE